MIFLLLLHYYTVLINQMAVYNIIIIFIIIYSKLFYVHWLECEQANIDCFKQQSNNVHNFMTTIIIIIYMKHHQYIAVQY